MSGEIEIVQAVTTLEISEARTELEINGGYSEIDIITAGVQGASGNARRAFKQVNSDYTLLAADSILWVDASAGAVNIYLPAATIGQGQIFDVKKFDSTSNQVNIIAAGSDLIDGSASVYLDLQNANFHFNSNGVDRWGGL